MASVVCGSCSTTNNIPAGSAQFQCGQCGTINSLAPAYGAPAHGGYSAPAPSPYGGPAPAPYGGPAPAPYGGPAPAPYGGPAPAPYGGPAPAYPAPAPMQMGAMGGGQYETLEDFAHLPDLRIVQRKRNWLFEMCCWEQESKFDVFPLAQQTTPILLGVEQSSCCARFCCANLRPATLELRNPSGTVIARYDRPLRCGAGALCCQQEISFADSKDARFGHAMIPCFLCTPRLDVFMDDAPQNPFTVEGPCLCQLVCNPLFTVTRPGYSNGGIQKVWGGLQRECCTNADIYHVTFPQQATAREKAGLIGAAFLIDYNFFERQQDHDERNR